MTTPLFYCRICGIALWGDTCQRCGADNAAHRRHIIDYQRGDRTAGSRTDHTASALAVLQAGAWSKVDTVDIDREEAQ